MSNMRDALGLRLPYGKTGSQYITEFDPATRTVWGYFQPVKLTDEAMDKIAATMGCPVESITFDPYPG